MDKHSLMAEHGDLKVVYDYNLNHCRLDPYPAEGDVMAYYEADRFYGEHSPADWFDKEREEYSAGLWNSYFDHLIEVGGQRDTILDYGCGPGWFIDYYRRRSPGFYWREGYNPSLQDAKYLRRARGPLAIISGYEPSLSAVSYGQASLGPLPIVSNLDRIKGQYDLIYLVLVLEHIVNPGEFLTRLVETHLSPGGRVVIVVPNDMNRLQKRLGYTGYIGQVHVNYFTPVTLWRLMKSAGLILTHESATFPMELFLLMGINYIGNDRLGRRCHRLRLQWERLYGRRVFDWYNLIYNRWGIGRELIFAGDKEADL